MSDLKKAKAKVQANLARKERELAALTERPSAALNKEALDRLVNSILWGSKKSLA